MSCNNIQIITDCSSVVVPQPETQIIQINTSGPQGPAGPAGPQGPAGIGSIDTGSFATTGSNVFKEIGRAHV